MAESDSEAGSDRQRSALADDVGDEEVQVVALDALRKKIAAQQGRADGGVVVAAINEREQMRLKLNELTRFERDWPWDEAMVMAHATHDTVTLGDAHAAGEDADDTAADEVQWEALLNDDLKREAAFVQVAREAAERALGRLPQHARRPADYFAEMIKSDVHMSKVREELLREQQQISDAQKRRKDREAARGKTARGQQREKEQMKREAANKMIKQVEQVSKERAKKALLKKRGFDVDDVDDEHGEGHGESDIEDDFPTDLLDVEEIDASKFKVHHAAAGHAKTDKKARGGKASPTGGKMSRAARDAKHGYGGPKRGAKRNDAKSFNEKDDGFRGERGQDRRLAGAVGKKSWSKGSGGKPKRLGKSRRQASR
ncbi:putative rRNA-processing protein EBP2-like [Porphyridium purpureum]|uniref:Putative rRNA-processing protein EBP2-like n=1 Tax=Porphyridium purpureum TaxID=35688 RepID=A0A5J4Z224_PORPP|nr:putative rRNA-processing protein EBP2-like [Porphyridium purpureum]|eukprot:POR1947..scf208_2